VTDRPAAPIAAFLVPKRGNTARQCDDSVRIAVYCEPGVPAGGSLVAAVADGASESLLSGAWADVLTEEAVRLTGSGDDADDGAAFDGAAPPGPQAAPRLLARIAGVGAARWPGFLAGYLAGRERDGKPLAWYEQPGIERGAHATLAVLELRRVPGGGALAAAPEAAPEAAPKDPAWSWHWDAVALGDSCVFHVRDGKLLAALPITSPDGFDTSPNLIGSRDPDLGLIAARSHAQSGRCETGDRLYLATDALSAWILAAADGSPEPWDSGGWEAALLGPAALPPEERSAAFAAWVGQRRADGSLRNDDVALACVVIGPHLAAELDADPGTEPGDAGGSGA
jgi:hypothetical protein